MTIIAHSSTIDSMVVDEWTSGNLGSAPRWEYDTTQLDADASTSMPFFFTNMDRSEVHQRHCEDNPYDQRR